MASYSALEREGKSKMEKEQKRKKLKSGKKEKTENNEKLEKKELLYILVPIIIIAVLLGAIFTIKYFYKSKPTYETVTYNGFVFTKLGDKMWTSQIQIKDQLYSAMFKYNPYEVENITVNYLANNFTEITKQQNKVYITFDPDSENLAYIGLASADISNVLSKVYRIQSIPACTKNLTSGCSSRPIQNCSTTGRVVIYIKDDAVQNVTYSGNCLTIQGKKEELVRASTRVIMEWYGIINPKQ